MLLELGMQTYEIIVASDGSTRDGLGLEVYRRTTSENVQVLEIFRSDKDNSVTFTSFEWDIPLQLVQRACRIAHDRLSLAGIVEEL